MTSDETYEALGRAIRERRTAKRMTQRELAENVGLSRASVANIERGRQSVLVDHLIRFAAALEVRPTDLLPSKPLPKERPVEDDLTPEAAAWIQSVRTSME